MAMFKGLVLDYSKQYQNRQLKFDLQPTTTAPNSVATWFFICIQILNIVTVYCCYDKLDNTV